MNAHTYHSVPQKIRSYFGSERVIMVIADISERAELYNLKTVPGILKQLITKTIQSKDFVEYVSEKHRIRKPKAAALAKELKQRVLMPIYHDLTTWGVDIAAIDVMDAAPLEQFQIDEHKPREATISLDALSPANDESVALISSMRRNTNSSAPQKPVNQPASTHIEPFMIHQQTTVTQKPNAVSSKHTFLSSFSFSSLFGKKPEVTASERGPVRVRVEVPGTVSAEKKPPVRVVDYSDLRTPLSQTPHSAVAPKPTPQEQVTQKQPALAPQTERITNIAPVGPITLFQKLPRIAERPPVQKPNPTTISPPPASFIKPPTPPTP